MVASKAVNPLEIGSEWWAMTILKTVSNKGRGKKQKMFEEFLEFFLIFSNFF